MNEKVALQTIVVALETKYNVSVSYATTTVSGISLLPPPEEFSLDEILAYLTNNTPLLFTIIDERYITVTIKTDNSIRCGKIYDAETGSLLAGATIQSEDGKYATITNTSGEFYIPNTSESNELTISHIGYETIQIYLHELSESCASILLIPAVTQLNFVTLNTLFTKGIDKELDGSYTINTTNFGLLPGQVEDDVLQIAQALPGVESVNETISNINIRGGTHDENLILWDNIKIYQSGHFFGLISAFNPDLTKKVTVHKNGTPARYGEGVSGVIAMYSKNSVTTDFKAGVGLNLINANAFVDLPVSKNASVQVSTRHSINWLLESPVYKNFSERIFQDTEITNRENPQNATTISADEKFSFYDISTKLLWDISEKDQIRLNFLTVHNKLDFTENQLTTASSETSELAQESIVGGISWERKWSNKLQTSALIYGSYYLLDAINKTIFTAQEQQQQNEVLDTGVKLNGTYQFSEKYAVEGGYHFSEKGIANSQDVNLPRFRSYIKNVLQSHVTFGNLAYTPNGDETIINGGVRVNYFDKFAEVIVEPRLSLHQKIGGGFAIEALGEFKNQAVTQRIDFESDFLGIEKRRWVLANDSTIPIIKSKQASLGILYKKSNWLVNIEGFYKNVAGITTANQAFQNQFQFTRASGDYTARGIEFTANKKLKSFSAWLTYLYMKNDYKFETLSPPEFPNNIDIRHSLTAAGTYTYNKLKVAIGFNFHSGKPNTFPVAGEEIIVENGEEIIQFTNPNEQRLPNYYRTDMSAEYLWDISDSVDVKINLAVLNIFDYRNTLNIHYALDLDENGNIRVNQVKEVSLGITPNFSLQILF
ncbi:TonB-dependent receptor domain-containing protein [Ulvibacter sp. MAR_2010_11]|uniref:TonB-dependent receptor n=1 Tax=Ulvibacter sp. MAR_2010_11 TaxID=1250229 RepID=UPI0018E26AA0|nr:TonB-dependent receptor [Ulvibacter sp. MAR_2010_11]